MDICCFLINCFGFFLGKCLIVRELIDELGFAHGIDTLGRMNP